MKITKKINIAAWNGRFWPTCQKNVILAWKPPFFAFFHTTPQNQGFLSQNIVHCIVLVLYLRGTSFSRWKMRFHARYMIINLTNKAWKSCFSAFFTRISKIFDVSLHKPVKNFKNYCLSHENYKENQKCCVKRSILVKLSKKSDFTLKTTFFCVFLHRTPQNLGILSINIVHCIVFVLNLKGTSISCQKMRFYTRYMIINLTNKAWKTW